MYLPGHVSTWACIYLGMYEATLMQRVVEDPDSALVSMSMACRVEEHHNAKDSRM